MGIHSFRAASYKHTVSSASLLETSSAAHKRDTGQWSATFQSWNCRSVWCTGPAGLADSYPGGSACVSVPGVPVLRPPARRALSSLQQHALSAPSRARVEKKQQSLKALQGAVRNCLHLRAHPLSCISCPQGISLSLAIKEKLGLCGFIKW